MAGQFEDQVALITGGNSGIGRATAIKFAEEGAKVVVAARRVTKGRETVRAIVAAGGEAMFVKTDVSKSKDVKAMVEKTVDTYGRLDFAFNNAGVGGGGLVHELDEKVWDRVIDTNLKGVWLCMKYQIAQMHKNGGGAIVNNSSVAGLLTPPRYVAYCASKHGVIAITKVAAVENAQEGIRINAVCPGWIETPMIEEALNDPERHAHILASEPMGRVGHPQEISDAVIWLCSKASSFVTGHALVVDGGLVVGRL